LALGLLTGCAPSLAWNWSKPGTFEATPQARYPEADAVYLLKERRILLVSNWSSPSYMQVQQHDVLRVLNEDGTTYADVRVPYSGDGEILAFEARTVGPDGEVREVEPTRVFDDDARKNEDDEDRNVKVRVFTLPHVVAGSIIEYQYTIQQPQLWSWLARYVNEAIPVESYRLAIEGTKDIRYAVKAYNTKSRWTTEKLGKTWRLSFAMDDVPATVDDERYAPNRELRDPRWVFRIKQFVKYNVVADRHRDWNRTLRYWVDDLLFDNEEWYAGFEADVKLDDCGDARCKLERVAEHLREALPFRGFGSMGGRKAKKVASAEEASAFEKTRIAWKLLSDAKVEVQFAFTDRYLHDQYDPKFPLYPNLDHLVLWLAPQEGLQEGVWYDASCEHCAIGELPYWLRDAEAYVISAEKKPLARQPVVKTEVRKVTGKLREDEAYHRTYAVKVGGDGELQVKLTVAARGRSAQDLRNDTRKRTDEDWKRSTERVVTNRVDTAKRTAFTKLVTGLDAAHYTVDFVAPNQATRDDEEVLVPLAMLTSGWEDEFEDPSQRSVDIHFWYPYRSEDTAIIEAPAGFEPSRWPEALEIEEHCVSIRIAAERAGNSVRVTRSIAVKAGPHDKSHAVPLRAAIDRHASLRQQFVAFSRR